MDENKNIIAPLSAETQEITKKALIKAAERNIEEVVMFLNKITHEESQMSPELESDCNHLRETQKKFSLLISDENTSLSEITKGLKTLVDEFNQLKQVFPRSIINEVRIALKKVEKLPNTPNGKDHLSNV